MNLQTNILHEYVVGTTGHGMSTRQYNILSNVSKDKEQDLNNEPVIIDISFERTESSEFYTIRS